MEPVYEIPQCVIQKLQMLDSITLNHSVRVAEIASGYEICRKHPNNLLSRAALVHDIGKVYISSKIIDKPGVLSNLEREIVNLHPYIGYKILKEDGVNDKICTIALYHHGINPPILQPTQPYEDDEVLNYAKMLRTIDSYEALTSDRPYRRGFSGQKAIEIMDTEENHHPDVMEYFRYLHNQGSL